MSCGHIPDGCILLARKVQASGIWEKPSDWLKIFIYILQEVNHKGNTHYERGTNFFNLRDVASDCGVSRNIVYHFIKWGKSAKLLATRKTTRGVVIYVLNYDKYQTLDNYKSDTKSDTSSETEAKQKRNRSDTINKNGKNGKNEKNTTVVDKKLLRWLKQNNKGKGYTDWIYREYGDTVEIAWAKVLAGHKVNCPSDFVELCKTMSE